MPTFMMILLMLLGLFMMLIVLIQRGRGGGLAGAFGGMGGQSAFGTKAGDVFTKITVVVAVLWVLLAGGSGIILRKDAQSRFTGGDRAEDGVLDVRDASGESELDTSAANDGAPLFGDDLLNTTAIPFPRPPGPGTRCRMQKRKPR